MKGASLNSESAGTFGLEYEGGVLVCPMVTTLSPLEEICIWCGSTGEHFRLNEAVSWQTFFRFETSMSEILGGLSVVYSVIDVVSTTEVQYT